MSDVTKEFIEEQNEKLATMVAQGFSSMKGEINELREDINGLHSEVGSIREILETKADKADIERLEDLINIGMSHRMEETDRVADRVQRLEMRVTRLEVSTVR